jgi:hypothetical protein
MKPTALHLAAWLRIVVVSAMSVGGSRSSSIIIDDTVAAAVTPPSNDSRFEFNELDHRPDEEEGGGSDVLQGPSECCYPPKNLPPDIVDRDREGGVRIHVPKDSMMETEKAYYTLDSLATTIPDGNGAIINANTDDETTPEDFNFVVADTLTERGRFRLVKSDTEAVEMRGLPDSKELIAPASSSRDSKPTTHEETFDFSHGHLLAGGEKVCATLTVCFITCTISS